MTYEHKTIIGPFTVIDSSDQGPFGEFENDIVFTGKQLMGFEIRAIRIILLAAKEKVDGSILKYARRSLGLKRIQLAELLDLTEQDIESLETKEKISMVLRLAMVALLNIKLRNDCIKVNYSEGYEFHII
jgi:hypothetical protein